MANRDISAGRWRNLKGRVREFWGRFTDDEVEQLDGRFEQLAGKVQEKYGIAKNEAADQVNDFLDRFGRDKEDAERKH